MKIIYTRSALVDLEEVHRYLLAHWSDVIDRFERRLGEIERTIADNPDSGHEPMNRPGVHTMAFVRLPHELYYSITEDGVEVLHIYHTSRHGRF
jgi:toxin ParE1/3/4